MFFNRLHFCSFMSMLVVACSINIEDVAHCPDYQNRYLDLELGRGMDTLTYNVSMDVIFKLNYSKCQTTPDLKFLIPDGVKVFVPKTRDKIEVDLIRYWENYKPLVRPNTVYPKISGSFSGDFQRAKKKIFQGNYIIRVDFRKPKYELYWDTFKFAFNDDFELMLTKISDYVANGDDEHAGYFTDSLIQKYGTSYVKSVILGGLLAIEFFIPKTRINVTDYADLGFILNATKIVFAKYFNLTSELQQDLKMYKNLTEFEEYEKFIFTDREIVDGDIWKKNVEDHPVIIDRQGNPLKNVASRPRSFKNIPKQLDNYLWKVLHERVSRYYKYNTHRGCTTFLAPNFALGANVNANCLTEKYNITRQFNFGGLYQTCTETPKNNNLCAEFSQKNILTGDYQCPYNFHQILILSKTIQKTMKANLTHKCAWNYNKRYCFPEVPTVDITLTTYWCTTRISLTKPAVNNVVTFGGIFTSVSPNPITGNMTCPVNYTIHKMDIDARVCLGFKNQTEDVVSFGGFFSNRNGNLLVDGVRLIHDCPKGFTQYLAYEEKDCRVVYCMDVNYYKNTFPKLISPVSNVFLRLEDATKETLMTAESDRDRFYFRNSTSTAWKFTRKLSEEIYKNVILRKLYEALLPTVTTSVTPSTSGNHGNARYRVSLLLPTIVSVMIMIRQSKNF